MAREQREATRDVIIRILVVDDSALWRQFVSSIAEKEPAWQIVCEVSDGLEAVYKAEELQPDLVLLDIGLPSLNGIEAARQIRKIVPNLKILFVSAFDSVKVVEEALSTGAGGYVVKVDAGSELVRAVEAVLVGKRFVSSELKGHISIEAECTQARSASTRGTVLAWPLGETLPIKKETTGRHDVLFYSGDTIFLESVIHFTEAALKSGNPVIVFATKPHREGLLHGLKAEGLDVDDAMQRGCYVSLDAAETLSTFMVNDWPDAVRFFQGFNNLIDSASKAAKAEHPRVAVFGEGVALLWAERKTEAAIRLEQLGNELAEIRKVEILCAYPFGLSIQNDREAFRTICAEHSVAFSW